MDDPQYVFQQIRQLKLTQDDLKRDITEVLQDDIRVVVNGELKVIDLEVSGLTVDQKKLLKEALNKAFTQAQEKILVPFQKKVAQ